MKKKIYKIYHIPDFVWKDGTKGKIGVTYKLTKRMKVNQKKSLQPFDKWEILEEHTCKFKVSDREIELQKQYGYKVDKTPYWKTINNPTFESRSKGGKIAGKIRASQMTFEERSYAGKCGGKVTAPKLKKWIKENPEHLKKIQKISQENRKKPILQYDKDGTFIREWDSIKECAAALGLHATSITVVCKGGNQKTCGGFVFKYKNP